MHIFARIIQFVFCARMDYSNLSQYERYLGNICVHACFAYVDKSLFECYFLSYMLHFMKIMTEILKSYKILQNGGAEVNVHR